MFTIVFDLDGTLIDTAPDLIATLNVTLTQQGLPSVPFKTARPLIGGGARGMIERALETEGRSCSIADVDRLYGEFVAHYAEHIADRSRPFPQLEPVLDRLAGEGYRLAVCTNKLEWLSKRLLDTLQLSARFAAICGQDTFSVQKPDPRIFRLTVARAGGKPDARDHGRGFGHRHPHRPRRQRAGDRRRFRLYRRSDCDVAPDRVISSFAQLPAAIVDLLRSFVAAVAALCAVRGKMIWTIRALSGTKADDMGYHLAEACVGSYGACGHGNACRWTAWKWNTASSRP